MLRSPAQWANNTGQKWPWRRPFCAKLRAHGQTHRSWLNVWINLHSDCLQMPIPPSSLSAVNYLFRFCFNQNTRKRAYDGRRRRTGNYCAKTWGNFALLKLHWGAIIVEKSCIGLTAAEVLRRLAYFKIFLPIATVKCIYWTRNYSLSDGGSSSMSKSTLVRNSLISG